MRLLGYTRTWLEEDLGEHDLEEQERALAEFCAGSEQELVKVVMDETVTPEECLQEAIKIGADGLVITDPMIITSDPGKLAGFVAQLAAAGKHLFIVCHNKHIAPDSSVSIAELVDQSRLLLKS